MIDASEQWKSAFYENILPETFVELSCSFGDPVAQDSATVVGVNEAYFSYPEHLMKADVRTLGNKMLTLETNSWLLSTLNAELYGDPENYNPYIPIYASQSDQGEVVVRFPEVVTTVVPGITITWGENHFGEYAKRFTVVAKNGTTEVASATVKANNSTVTQVELELTNYDSITVKVTEWSMPEHRVRINDLSLGHTVVFDKKDILSFSHEQTGCVNSGELPHSEIRFSIDNSNKRWDPYDPTGDTKFISERQRISVRYGLDIGGNTEWIDAGLFYLSEWKIPANGFEAQFVATDILTNCSGIRTDMYTIKSVNVNQLFADWNSYVKNEGYGVPSEWLVGYLGNPDLVVDIPGEPEGRPIGELLQMLANFTGCVIKHPAIFAIAGYPVTRLEPLDTASVAASGFITLDNAYSYPELELTKPLKSVSVAVADDERYVLNVNADGETLTIDNPLVRTTEDAARIAEWIAGNTNKRKILRGEFRADPRAELFDVMYVETGKKGMGVAAEFVVLTNIKYTYSGSFHGTYEGYVL